MGKVIDLKEYKEDRDIRIGLDEEHIMIFMDMATLLMDKLDYFSLEESRQNNIIGKLKRATQYFEEHKRKYAAEEKDHRFIQLNKNTSNTL